MHDWLDDKSIFLGSSISRTSILQLLDQYFYFPIVYKHASNAFRE
jgi:hypothetical protein